MRRLRRFFEVVLVAYCLVLLAIVVLFDPEALE